MAPYRLLHVWDFDVLGDKAFLSKAAGVMKKLSTIAIEKKPDLTLRDMSISESREVFASSFDTLCMTLTRGADNQDIDRRHYGDSSYVTFYDMISLHKKRTLAEATSTDRIA